MYTIIQQIRKSTSNTLLVNTGDTIQGSGEALFTLGQALVNVVDLFGVDAYAPGNWDYVYGPERFKELFVNDTDPEQRRWHGLAANLYYSSTEAPASPPATATDVFAWYAENGENVLPPYLVKTLGSLRIGVVGCTTQRGPQVVGAWTTQGFFFTNCNAELRKYVRKLRYEEDVDIVVLISEIELGRNIRLVEEIPGIDVVLSSDMHEATIDPVEVTNTYTGGKVLLVEEGQDGTNVGELALTINRGRVTDWQWNQHRVNSGVREDRTIAKKVAEVRAPYNGPGFDPVNHPELYVNVFNGTTLQRPLDEVVGETQVNLYRGNFTNEDLPGALEGTSHDWIADAMKWKSGADISLIRGFRYGTHVRVGPITMNDLYHFVPIGPRLGLLTSKITPTQLKTQIENSSKAMFDTNPENWRGGWMFGYSGVMFDFNPYAPSTATETNPLNANTVRGTNVAVNGTQITDDVGDWTDAIVGVDQNGTAFDLSKDPLYTVAGYWYEGNPKVVSGCNECSGTIDPINDDNDQPLDLVEVLVQYLQEVGPANPETGRIHLVQPLPAQKFGFPEVQPLRGAVP